MGKIWSHEDIFNENQTESDEVDSLANNSEIEQEYADRNEHFGPSTSIPESFGNAISSESTRIGGINNVVDKIINDGDDSQEVANIINDVARTKR